MNLRKDKRKQNLKKWKATPPAVIDSPLQKIHAIYPDTRNANGTLSHQPFYAEALRAAKQGNGAAVKDMARQAIAHP
jgi:hypothetical protein